MNETPLSEIAERHPLAHEYEEDARYVWPERWNETGLAFAALETERDELKARLEAYDHLLDCKRGWRWDLEQRGMNMVEAGAYMVVCNRAAAPEEE